MKKPGLCFIVCLVAIFVAIFVPWEKLDDLKDKMLGVGESFASLKVYSLGGDMEVYLNDESKGVVRSEDPYLEVFPVRVGEHKVRLVREATIEGFYPDFERVIKFEKGFDTVISWEVGPTEQSSSGWILYAQKMSGSKGVTLLNISCNPEDCNINKDGEESQEAPISNMELMLDDQHTFKASREGYQDLEFQVLPEDKEARSKLDGYVLYLEVNLYKIPI